MPVICKPGYFGDLYRLNQIHKVNRIYKLHSKCFANPTPPGRPLYQPGCTWCAATLSVCRPNLLASSCSPALSLVPVSGPIGGRRGSRRTLPRTRAAVCTREEALPKRRGETPLCLHQPGLFCQTCSQSFVFLPQTPPTAGSFG